MNTETVAIQREHNETILCRVREFTIAGEINEMGKSRVKIVCPFCGAHIWAYKWSLAGCGKRCTCRAIFSSFGSGAYKKIDNSEIGKILGINWKEIKNMHPAGRKHWIEKTYLPTQPVADREQWENTEGNFFPFFRWKVEMLLNILSAGATK